MHNEVSIKAKIEAVRNKYCDYMDKTSSKKKTSKIQLAAFQQQSNLVIQDTTCTCASVNIYLIYAWCVQTFFQSDE